MEMLIELLQWVAGLAVVGLAVWVVVRLVQTLRQKVGRPVRSAKTDRRQHDVPVDRDRRRQPRRGEDVASEFLKDLDP